MATLPQISDYKDLFRKNTDNRGHHSIESYERVKSSLASSYGTGTVSGSVGDSVIYGKKERVIARNTITLERIFQADDAVKLFYAFASSRHVHEGILFWEEVEAFQNADWKPAILLGIERKKRISLDGPIPARNKPRSKDEIRIEAQKIYQRFLSDHAEYQVCIPSSMNETLEKDLRTGDFDIDIFREAQRIVFRDMEKGLFREFLSCLNSKGLALVESAIKNYNLSPGLATLNALQSVDRRGSEEKC